MSPPVTADGTATPLVASATIITSDARRRFIRRVGLLCVTGLAGSCASLDRHPRSNRYSPAFYQVTPPDGYRGRAWLIGAVHGSSTNLLPLPAAVQEALNTSTELAIELDAKGQRQQLLEAFGQRTRLPAGDKLDNYLPSDSINWLKKRFELSQEQWRTFSRLQPWSVMQVLRGLSRPASPARHPGFETVLINHARQRGLPLTELETPDEQVRALAGGSLAEQSRLLQLRIGDENFWDNRIEPVIQAWRNGNETELKFLKERTFGTLSDRQQSQALAQLHKRLFDVRDRLMARRLINRLREPRRVFAAVGAFHLVGQPNLIKELQRLGATVARHKFQTH